MRLLTLLLTSVVVLSACASSTTTTTVMAMLTDKEIQLDNAAAPPGIVTFRVGNMGTTIHNLYLLKTDVPHDQIAADHSDPARVDVKGALRETGQIEPHAMKEFSVRLTAGKYVLVCNEPAHYAVGMHTAFAVK